MNQAQPQTGETSSSTLVSKETNKPLHSPEAQSSLNNASTSTVATGTNIMPTHNASTTTINTTASATTANNAEPTATLKVVEPANNSEADEEAIRNQKLVEEFQYLLEKSQSLFSGLRDLPPTGSHRQWRPYFEKTFEVYTKLWKFQQTHRSILEDKSNYGLKRWEVGEIASKIGQLYYHYYLRTSETNYLYEAYVFYEAIHERQYFKDVLEVKNSALMIKKMRYYARFIIVCLLLNKDENVRQLITELEGLIEEYTKSFKPPDAKEWQMVLEEISTFTEAEKKLVPINLDRTPDKIEHRLSSNIAERNLGHFPKLKLQEAILVGNYQKQIKFSELTLDMYRMLQSLERKPFVMHPSVTNNTTTNEKKEAASKEDNTNVNSNNPKAMTTTATTTAGVAATTITTTAAAPASAATTTAVPSIAAAVSSANNTQNNNANDKMNKRSNPHKYLLYKPSLSQLLVYISTAFKDTSENSALLLYLSADGCSYPERTISGYGGGVLTSQRNRQTSIADRTGAGGSTSTNVAANVLSSNPNGPSAQASSSLNIINNNNINSNSNNASTLANNTTASNNNLASTTTQPTEVAAVPPSAHCLHPADLIPFTRKPLFLIVDSDNSIEFKNMPNVFDQPVMCLMSPVEYPSSVQDKSEIGSLFTLFLHTPLLGFCSVSDIGNLDQSKWDECVRKIDAMEKAIGALLISDASVDKNVKRFMFDDFLYYFIVRFVLCGIFLRYHSSFKDEKSFPTCCPSLPESIYVSTEIVTMLGDLTAIADVGTYFSLPAYASATNNTSNTLSSSPSASVITGNSNVVMDTTQ
ncbi:uncharacterized protein B0P05DRAFT_589953 [Gilbertella persicaria]|uniref:uncharacterized protein n=1 Tax=Gilbertella persicaria TaxID=101096 RepID=UPI00221FEC28|nr:uncharacterized protein B0P05DRAFT_589953 [Gilbertella persicaria]KAI8065378.1 hypothetical protein B0P05DRAFT_589953 [Gilbertella persicaria]